MKNFLTPIILLFPFLLFAQNLSWEQKVSPEYSYKLPQKEKQEANAIHYTKRSTSDAASYNKLLLQREELKANIASLEKNQNSEKDKQWLDKYKVSLKFIEEKILETKTLKKKEK